MEKFLHKLKRFAHWLLAHVTYWYYGRPSRHLIVIGVTGTKGKSTTSRLIASVLEAGGHKVGLLSTVEFQIAERRFANDKKMTMLGRGQIQKMLKEMVAAGCRYVVVETSSEGILQFRHIGLNYDVAVFTNLGSEHSERHGGYNNLRADKGKMFAALTKSCHKTIAGKKVPKIIIANVDDQESSFYLGYKANEKIAYCFRTARPNLPKEVSLVLGVAGATDKTGSVFLVDNQIYRLNIIGSFNQYNGLAAVAVGKSQKLTPVQIAKGLASVDQVAGRMEFIEEGQNFKVVVDYAHEPMSLTALFKALKNLVGPNNKVIGVIGSDGGGRDVTKRGKMGQISGELCDYLVVTDVNCFDEDPVTIAEMLAKGARATGKKDNENLFIEVDRRKGIQKAFSLAQMGDVVAITAKGTEPVICVANGVKIPWDDRTVSREVIREMKISSVASGASK